MELPFPVLSDPGLTVTRFYGLVHEKGALFSDVPRPTTILVGADGVIRWIHAPRNIRSRPTPEEIFEELRK
jgi:peroxiredoxin